MSNMDNRNFRTFTRLEQFIIGTGTPNMERVMLARRNHIKAFGRLPQELRLGTMAYRFFVQQDVVRGLQYPLVKLWGMDIHHDQTLLENEWRLGRTDEITKLIIQDGSGINL